MRRSEGSRLGRRLSSWPFLFFFPRAKGVDDEILNADNAGMLSMRHSIIFARSVGRRACNLEATPPPRRDRRF